MLAPTMEFHMRILTATLLTAAALGAVLTTTPAQAYDRRICLIEGSYPYAGDCAYDTYAQCNAAASGLQAYCDVNPNFAFAEAAGRRYRPRDGINLSPLVFGHRYY
jgi:hypothetical protein